MKALLLLLAGIPMSGAVAADRVYENEYNYETVQPIYEWTCDYMDELYEDFVCPPQPVVVTAEMRKGLWGYYYRGSQIIWVSDRLTDQPLSVFGEAIIAHEAVHYVLSFIDDLQSFKDQCRNEGMAWDAYNQYVASYGFEHLQTEDWWKAYDRCSGPDVDAKATWNDIVGLVEDLFPEAP